MKHEDTTFCSFTSNQKKKREKKKHAMGYDVILGTLAIVFLCVCVCSFYDQYHHWFYSYDFGNRLIVHRYSF